MNRFALIVCCLLISGCMTPMQPFKAKIGHPISEMIQEWGAPSSITSDPPQPHWRQPFQSLWESPTKPLSGKRIYTWTRNQYLNDQVFFCKQSFTVDGQDVIRDFSQTSGCW